MDPGCGFNVDIIERLLKSIDLEKTTDFQKNVAHIFDEMKNKVVLFFVKQLEN